MTRSDPVYNKRVTDKLITLSLLGRFQLEIPGQSPPSLRRKSRALLAYLAVTGSSHARHELAALFCQNAAAPLRTFRLLLSRVRGVLHETIIQTEGENVWLDPSFLKVDVQQFRQYLDSDLKQVDPQQITQAVALYRGEFLAGLYLSDAPEFELWLLGYRAYIQRLYERGLLTLLHDKIEHQVWHEAISLAQKLLQHNTLLEEAHYHLIWLYEQTGQHAAALSQYEQCRTILQNELAVAPMPELLELYHQIRAGQTISPRRIKLSSLTPAVSQITAFDFVGRESEWQRLDGVWREVQQGRGRVVLIRAEAGGGKTRLVQEWGKTLPEGTLVYGPCYESTRALAYQPWQIVLEQVRKQLAAAAIQTLPAPLLQALARLFPDLAHEDQPLASGQQTHLFAAVQAFLQLVGQPLLLFIDDWQWADAASLQLIHFLVERETPFLLVGAYRSEEAEDNPALLTLLRDWGRREDLIMFALKPLSSEAIATLMSRLWPQLPDGYREPHLRDRLVQATGGNPLFVNEIVRELAGTMHLPEELPVPPSLRELIRRRLHQLSASGRQVLESLAILNQPAGFEQVRQISGRSEDETLEALELGLRWRLLVTTANTPAQMDFSHDLMGQAVREQISPIRQQLLHRRAAATLSQHGVKAARLAYHWRKAGDSEQERLAVILAGHDAAALYAHQEAIQHWQRALELADDATQKASLHHQIGRSWVTLGDWEQAERMYQAGLALVREQSNPIRAQLQAAYGLLLEYKGEYAAALTQEEPALAYFQSINDRPQIARTLGLIALLHWRQARYDESLHTCQQALADPEAMTDPTTHIRLLNISGLIHWRQQALETALTYLQQAHELTLYHQDRQYEAIVVSNLGNVVQEMGRYDEAIAYYQQALKLNQAMQNKMGIAMNLGNLGLMYFYKGDDAAAIEYGRQALQMDQALGNQESVARHLSNLANSLSRLEQYEAAFEHCQQALLIDAELGNRRGALIHAGNMSDIYLLWGHTTEALLCLTYALYLDDRLEHKRELARHLMNIVTVYLLMNQAEQAETVCQWAMTLQQELDNTFELGWAFLVQGRLFGVQEQFAAAATALQLAIHHAQVSHRADIQFEAEVQWPRMQWLAGALDAAAAQQHLQILLEKQPTLRQQADISYELWHLTQNPAYQNQARGAYEALLQHTRTAEAYQRAVELGAKHVTPLAAAPPLPSLIIDTPLNLDSLLEKVKQNLAPHHTM